MAVFDDGDRIAHNYSSREIGRREVFEPGGDLGMTLATILIVILCAGAVYALAASMVCTERNDERFHWWCPLCHVCRLFARRMVP
jgi:hypothetical protein